MKPGSIVLCIEGINQSHPTIVSQPHLFANWQWPIAGKTYTVALGSPCCDARFNIVELPNGTVPAGFGPQKCSHCGTVHDINGGWGKKKFIQLNDPDASLTETNETEKPVSA